MCTGIEYKLALFIGFECTLIPSPLVTQMSEIDHKCQQRLSYFQQELCLKVGIHEPSGHIVTLISDTARLQGKWCLLQKQLTTDFMTLINEWLTTNEL